jgi:HAD superfamily hydrolase (TIGR01509 family)
MSQRAVGTLFDFDGVLVDSEPVHLAAFNDVLAGRGMAIDPDEYATRYLSLDDEGVFRAVLSLHGAPVRDDEVQALVLAKGPRFMARFEDSFRPFPGAARLVLRRAERGPVGIVSGSLAREIAFALERMGLEQAVSFVVSADRSPASKPDPAPYRIAIDELRRLGCAAAAAVAVEDSLGGVASAKGAGLRCVAVAHSCLPDDLLRGGADACAPNVDALTDALLDGGS